MWKMRYICQVKRYHQTKRLQAAVVIWHWNWIQVKWIDFCEWIDFWATKMGYFLFVWGRGNLISEFCQALHWKNVFHEKKNKTSELFFICVFYLNLTEIMRFFYHCLFKVHFFSWPCGLTGVWYNKKAVFSLLIYFSYIHFFILNFCYFFLNSALCELIT